MAVTGLKFDVVVYLAGKGAKGETFAGRLWCACEEGHVDGVKAMVEGHDVGRRGCRWRRWSVRGERIPLGNRRDPLTVAAIGLKFDVVVYLTGKGADASGTPLVCACEKGRLEDVRMLVEGHDVEKTGMSVEEMVSKEGKDSYGNSYTFRNGSI